MEKTHEIPVKVKPEPINNTDLVNKFRAEGGGIFHVRPVFSRRGVTIAYRLKSSRVEFATAVQHGADDFTKKIGTKTAIEHLLLHSYVKDISILCGTFSLFWSTFFTPTILVGCLS